MTLQDGIVTGKSAYLWADTAYFADDGAVAGFGSKIIHSTEWPWAITTSIIGATPQCFLTIARNIGGPRVPCLGDLLDVAEAECRRWVAEAPGRTLRLLIAGWDKFARETRLFMVSSDGAGAHLPFAPAELGHLVCSANDTPEYAAIVNGGGADAMAAMIDRQRASTFDSPGYPPGRYIGGDCIRVRVSRTGVKAKIIREWNDEIGRKIGCDTNPIAEAA